MATNNSLNLNASNPLPATEGGTGISNLVGSTVTLGGAFAMSGAHTFAGTLTANTAVTFPTSGTLVAGGANSSITNLTGLTGVLQAPTFVNDSSGNHVLGFASSASAVNYFNVLTAVTAAFPQIAAVGSDANINFGINTKGTGALVVTSVAATTPFQIFNGTASQHSTAFAFANTSANRTVTFPDVDGTVTLLGNASTGSGSVVLETSPTLVTPTLGAAAATSINFGGSSLNNYAEFTSFTPVFTCVTPGDLSVSYVVQTGYYTRIGNVVYYKWTTTCTPTFITASGNITITGAPFAANSQTAINCSGSGFLNGALVTWPAGVTYVIPQINAGTSLWLMQGVNVASGTGGTSLAMTNIVSGSQIVVTGTGFYFV